MKRLYLIRHAKSSWDHPGLHDEERPLNDRGVSDAPFMANWLVKTIEMPDLIAASAAKRASQTAVFFAKAFHIPEQDIRVEPRIYEASVPTLLRITGFFPDSFDRILLIGHNPGMSGYVRYLTGRSADEMSTCSIAAIALDISSWQEITSGAGRLEFLVHPKSLQSATKD